MMINSESQGSKSNPVPEGYISTLKANSTEAAIGSETNNNVAAEEPYVDRRIGRTRDIKGPAFHYYDRRTHNWVVPEAYHDSKPTSIGKEHKIRFYDHAAIKYTYHCEGKNS